MEIPSVWTFFISHPYKFVLLFLGEICLLSSELLNVYVRILLLSFSTHLNCSKWCFTPALTFCVSYSIFSFIPRPSVPRARTRSQCVTQQPTLIILQQTLQDRNCEFSRLNFPITEMLEIDIKIFFRFLARLPIGGGAVRDWKNC